MINKIGPILYFLSFIFKLLPKSGTMYVISTQNFDNQMLLFKELPGKVFFIHPQYWNTENANKFFPNTKIRFVSGPISKAIYFFSLIFSKIIILADSIHTMKYISFSKSQVRVQLWHASGAFKRFGACSSHNNFSIEENAKIANYNLISVSSNEVIDLYAKSLSTKKTNVLPLGTPRTDIFFDSKICTEVTSRMRKKYSLKKKIILYAPTYRNKNKESPLLDFSMIPEEVFEKYHFLIKLHPLEKRRDFSASIIDVSEHFYFNELLLISDILITDFSSAIFEFSLLERPILFFAKDLEVYQSENVRGFYYNYIDFIPGPFFDNEKDIFKALLNLDHKKIKSIIEFKKTYLKNCDGKSAKRIANYIRSIQN